MEKSTRDTKFLGWASRVVEKLNEYSYICDSYGQVPSDGDVEAVVTELLAQAAYDLACHVVCEHVLHAHGDMAKIRDFDTWPL